MSQSVSMASQRAAFGCNRRFKFGVEHEHYILFGSLLEFIQQYVSVKCQRFDSPRLILYSTNQFVEAKSLLLPNCVYWTLTIYVHILNTCSDDWLGSMWSKFGFYSLPRFFSEVNICSAYDIEVDSGKHETNSSNCHESTMKPLWNSNVLQRYR